MSIHPGKSCHDLCQVLVPNDPPATDARCIESTLPRGQGGVTLARVDVGARLPRGQGGEVLPRAEGGTMLLPCPCTPCGIVSETLRVTGQEGH